MFNLKSIRNLWEKILNTKRSDPMGQGPSAHNRLSQKGKRKRAKWVNNKRANK